MVFNKIEDCCNFAFDSLDGVYGWSTEVIAIIIFVVIFNFLTKVILAKLHKRLERQNKIWKDSFVKALHTPLSYFIWIFALIQTFDLIATRIYYEIPIDRRHHLIAVAALFCVSWFFLRWKRLVVQRMTVKCKNKEINLDPGKISVLDKLATVAIIFFSILILMEITHRSVNTLIAFGGVGGLALAFASQEIIANFFGGFMIYLTQPFTLGDWILIPDHAIEGYVEDIGWYMTRIRSLDKRPIYIPNSIFSKLIVITPSRMSHRQIKETIGIRYNDLPKLKQVVSDIKEMLKQHSDIDNNQSIIARLNSFGESSVDILINVYTQTTSTEGFMKIKEDVLLKISEILIKHDAQFAFPTQVSILQRD